MREQLRFLASPTGAVVAAGAALIAVGSGTRGPSGGVLAGAGGATLAAGLLRRSDHSDSLVRERVDALERAVGTAGTERRSLRRLVRDLRGSHGDLEGRLDRVFDELAVVVHRIEMTDEFAHGQTDRIVDRVREAETRLGTVGQRLERLTGVSGMTHARDLDDGSIDELLEYWNPRLGSDVARRAVRHLLLRAQHMELTCRGRLATHLADLVIRSLAVGSAPGDEVDILEIGTLFGIGGLLVRDHIEGRGRRARLTVIDPLSGYYGEHRLDPPTGLSVSRENLAHNAARFGVGQDDLVVLEGLSTDAEIRERAASQSYGALIIDGDHSYEGIKADYELYADLVEPGGVLVVDDYGTTDWPDVGQFTDEAIVPDPRFEMVGATSRTAVFRRR